MIDDVTSTYVRDLLEDNASWEEMLVAAADKHADVVSVLSPTLCVHPIHQRQCVEFDDRHLNALYICIKKWHQITLTLKKEYTPVPVLAAENLLKAICKSPDPCGVSEGEILKVAMTLARIRLKYKTQDLEAPALTAWSTWLGKRRLAKSINSLGGGGNFWMPTDLYEAMTAVRESIPHSRMQKTSFSVSELYTPKDALVKKLKTGIPEIDQITGGGFPISTTAYCLAASGAGKTVAACQLGSRLVLNNPPGTNVLIITTEQPAQQLWPRLVAATAGLRLREDLRLGLIKDIMNEEEKQKADMVESLLGPSLRIVNWQKKDGATTFADDLMEIIRAERKNFGGKLDAVIFDWLGASLNLKVGNRPDALRILYKTSADSMSDIARDEDLFILFFGQADPTKNSKKHIGPEDSRECKDLHFNAAISWGMSALLESTNTKRPRRGFEDEEPEKKEDDNEAKAVYCRQQWWNFFKVRIGTPRCIPVSRQFECQRFLFSTDAVVTK